jgi:uncharacterized membrane protein
MNDTQNFFMVFILLVIFSFLIYLVKPLYDADYVDKETDYAYKKLSRFIIPTISVFCFFISTYFVAAIIQEGNFRYAGIYYMILLCILFSIFNNTVLSSENINKYIKGKKFTPLGLLMAMGVGSIVFGFLDNFGLKLGTDALDTGFLNLFLGRFSVDSRFKDYQPNIAKNITILNTWSNSKWRSLLNQLLRFHKEIKSTNSNTLGFKDFIEDLEYFVDPTRGGGPLQIPDGIINKGPEVTYDYVQNIKEKFDLIDGSKSMMGNTFSDFIGAILGAAIINLFMYMTAYDGIETGDESIDNSFWVRNYNAYMPFLEALCMAIGCLLPVFINIAMTRDDYNTNNKMAWILIGIVSVIVLVIMYFSVRGVKDLTPEEKKRSLKKTLTKAQERLDVDEELKQKIENFKETI